MVFKPNSMPSLHTFPTLAIFVLGLTLLFGAATLGLALPADIVARADEVFD